MSKIRVPKIQVITIDEKHSIHITEEVYGTLCVLLLDDNYNVDKEGCEIKICDYSGENVFISLPKKWIGREVLVRYEREVEAEKREFSSDQVFHFYIDNDTGELKPFRQFKCGDNIAINIYD